MKYRIFAYPNTFQRVFTLHTKDTKINRDDNTLTLRRYALETNAKTQLSADLNPKTNNKRPMLNIVTISQTVPKSYA